MNFKYGDVVKYKYSGFWNKYIGMIVDRNNDQIITMDIKTNITTKFWEYELELILMFKNNFISNVYIGDTK